MSESARKPAATVRPLPSKGRETGPPARRGVPGFVLWVAGMMAVAVGAGLFLRSHLGQGTLPWQSAPAMTPKGESHLLQVLRTMPERSAISLLLQMPPDTAATLLVRLPAAEAGAYLSAMPPAAAGRLALLMAAKGGSG